MRMCKCDELISSLRMQITQITTQLATIQQAHSGCDDMKQRYNMLVREHSGCPNEMRIVMSELTTVQREYKSLIRDHLGCADMISSQQLRLNSMSQELTHKSNLCGVGLRISQFNPQELAKNKSQANLLGAHGVAQAHDHKGNVWVSKVIPGGSAAINGIIKEDDQVPPPFVLLSAASDCYHLLSLLLHLSIPVSHVLRYSCFALLMCCSTHVLYYSCVAVLMKPDRDRCIASCCDTNAYTLNSMISLVACVCVHVRVLVRMCVFSCACYVFVCVCACATAIEDQRAGI